MCKPREGGFAGTVEPMYGSSTVCITAGCCSDICCWHILCGQLSAVELQLKKEYHTHVFNQHLRTACLLYKAVACRSKRCLFCSHQCDQSCMRIWCLCLTGSHKQ
jgi:hypothetical protein